MTSTPVPVADEIDVVVDLTNEKEPPVLAPRLAAATSCVMSLEPFYDPVVASDGHTYERGQIEEWFKRSRQSPRTGKNLTDLTLTPNWAMREVMEALGYQVASVADLPPRRLTISETQARANRAAARANAKRKR